MAMTLGPRVLMALLALLLSLATEAAGFNCSSSGCVNGPCNATSGACTCPTDTFLTFSGNACDQVNLISITSPAPMKLVATNTSYLESQLIDLTVDATFKSGIPLGNKELATRIYVCSNGYITFHNDFCTTRIDLLKGSGAPPFVAPFASSFDFRKSVGSVTSVSEVSYVLVPSVDAAPQLKLMRDNNTELTGATAAVVITWSQMSPPVLDATQKASFQLILFTDFEKVTAQVMLYSAVTLKDYFDWLPTLMAMNPTSTGSLTTYADTRSKSVALSMTKGKFGTLQATMIVAPMYKGTDLNYRLRCFNEAATPLQPPISSETLGWCPRNLKQARWDPRYRASVNQTVFSLIASTVTNATQITCAYHEASGGLVSLNSYSNITNNENVTVGAKLYENCCDRMPNLCTNYYEKFPTPTSEKYQGPSAVGFAMGAGELRSFDGLLSRYLAVGDFWLVKAVGKLGVQVRMQNANPGANRTAGITGVAVQFSGAAVNFTVEFHWSKVTRQLQSVHYSVNSGQLMNNTLESPLQFVSNGAILIASQASLTCYVLGSSTWLSARANPNGLQVSVYLDKRDYFNGTAGLLGNYDDAKANDVAQRNGTVPAQTQDGVNLAMTDWKLATMGESLFRVQAASPTAESGWAALYWAADWNQTQLVKQLFTGNDTLFSAANQSCSSQPSNSTEYQNCLMEFSDCAWSSPAAACSAAYLDQLTSATQSVADFVGCAAPPQWNSTRTEVSGFVSATEGAPFQLSLSGLLSGNATGATFAKVSGPSGLSVAANGSLTWTPSLADLSPIVVSVAAVPGCPNLLQLTVRLTRTTSGVCANSAEDFGYLTSPVGESYRRDKIYQSTCKCNANYYTSNCSFPTCQLDCHTCSDTSVTACAAACPANYDQSVAGSLNVCAYLDRCTAALCNSTGYKACRSVDPALQSDSLRYQCQCDTGYQYPSTLPLNKTVCTDIDECQSPVYCDQSNNMNCTNLQGTFTCTCKTGYSMQAGSCADINECSATGICSNGSCVNTPGSYYCNCSAGYYVASTGQNCEDVNECTNPALSGCRQTCTNTAGSYSCSCYPGFSPPPQCAATAACANASACSYADMCTKVGSIDTCYCPQSQLINADNRTCNSTKYCTTDVCGAGGICTETNPGYNCTCKQYYELNAAKICVPTDYCNRMSQFPSVCPVGANVVCTVNATTNAPTCVCPGGFARNAATNACEDVNECAAGGAAGCDPASAECLNLIGSYRCACKFGYKRVNATQCTPAPYAYRVQARLTDFTYQADYANSATDAFKQMADVIEKRLEAALASDGTGQPTVRVSQMSNGSVVAVSVASYASPKTPDSLASSAAAAGIAVTAGALNECASASTNDCSPTVHTCVDTTDGYTCQCKSGYTQTGTVSGYAGTAKVVAVCADIDECLTECRNGSNKVCVNLPGSFTCSCANGTYSANATAQACADPCVAGRCQNGGQCQYQVSDQFPYRCVCPAGYLGFNCELEDGNYRGMQRNAIIIGVVLGVFLLVCLALIAIFYVRKSHSGGTYKGTQAVALSDTSIPRAHNSGQGHPSSYENTAYERDAHKTRTDYF